MKTKKKRPLWQRIGRFLFRFMVFLFFLSIALRICLESSPVQNWLVDKVTNYLSKELNTRVEVKHVDFALFNSVLLDDVLVEDSQGDTLLFVGELKARIRSGFWGFVKQDIKVESLDLNNGKLSLYRDVAMMDGNMGFIMDYFGSNKNQDSLGVDTVLVKKVKKQLLLGVENVGLHNIIVENIDLTKGEHIEVWLGNGDITGLDFNKDENLLSLDEIILDKFHFHYFKKDRQLPPPPKESIDRDSSYKYFIAKANKLKAIDGHFEYFDETKIRTRLKFENTMDFSDLDVRNIQADIDNFWMREDLWFKGRMNNMEASEKSGFVLKPSKVDDVEVTCEELHLYGMELNTPTTKLGDTLEMRYRSGYPAFLTFVDDVRLNAILKPDSKLSLKDIFTFAPELQNNRFFKNNSEEVLQIQGEMSGSINSLKTKDFLLKIGNRLTMKGDLRTRNLTVKGEESFDFDLEKLVTDIPSIRALVPGFNAPEQFDKLGKLNFKGRFLGFLTDFSANGYLKTDIGDVRSDINMKGGKTNAKYSGSLDLISFDLGQWAGNPDLGLISFSSEVKNGVGLDLSAINADLSAEVSSFTFKGYTYKLLNIGGKFDKKKFDGNVNIKDENIAMNFSGLVDFNERIPEFNFNAVVDKLKLDALNLSKKPFDLNAVLDFNFKGLELKDFVGEASASKVELYLDTTLLAIDSIYASIEKQDDLNKRVMVRSEVLTGELSGKFEIDELPKIIMSYANRNFPKFTSKLNIKPSLLGFNEPRNFEFDFFTKNSKNLTQFISPKLDTIFNFGINGYFDSRVDSLVLEAGVERARFDDFEFDDITLDGEFEKNKGELNLGIYHSLSLRDSFHIAPIALKNKLHNDTFDFDFELNDFTQVLNTINLNGSLTFDKDDIFKVTFGSSNMALFNHKWEIRNDNFVRFGKGIVETQNFKMTNLDLPRQKVELNSIGDKGLSLSIAGMDLSILNPYINYDKLLLSGSVTELKAEAMDIFKLEDLTVKAEMDTLFINDEDFGKMGLLAFSKNLKSEVAVGISVERAATKLAIQGEYRTPFLEKKPNYLDLNISMDKYPLSLSEYFIGENISDTKGNIDAELKLKGPVKSLQLTGTTRVYDAMTTIDYLQTSIAVPNGNIAIRPNLIDLSDLLLYDKEGNVAVVSKGSGITKDGLSDFGLDIEIKSNKFIALDTNIDDNETFYGKGIGRNVTASFTGDFKNTNMVIEATTTKGTEIFLPITSSRSESELSFITFTDTSKTNIADQFLSEEIRGLDLELNLHITPEAKIQLVIDQNAGDVLKGRGSGDLAIYVTRDGDFKMYGKYTVDQGHYLFTLLNVINKPFIIKEGGTINWDGDPLAAKINLEAAYENLSTTPYNFILEYLTDTDEKLEAQRTTPVDLTMELVGELFQPDISFDIGFPNLRGRVKTYTDSKLRIIKEDNNELNRQVLGLIAFGSFFPSDMNYSNSGLIDGGINTLSELLSNQLSIYLGELLSEVIRDVDIDFNYRYYELQDIGLDDYKSTGSELEVRLKKGLFNNRLVINAGSNFDIDGGTDSGAFLAGDLLIEYLLTPDGRFKMRFYSGSDLTISGRRNQTGVGFTYRREFNSFNELFKKTNNRMFKLEREYKVFLRKLQDAAKKSMSTD